MGAKQRLEQLKREMRELRFHPADAGRGHQSFERVIEEKFGELPLRLGPLDKKIAD